ncbi:MAG: hypothetical protein QOH79_2585 [Acidimicrobiaceae bacterium]
MTSPYDARFYDDLRDGARRSARRVVPLVLELTGARSVVDVGAGSGIWLAVFREHGVDRVLGIEGEHLDLGSLDIPPELFVLQDLALPVDIGERYDLAVSLEVAEHLPESVADCFVESLTRLAPLVLFSAAAPHQGGTEHVNEQWPDWWAARFQARGYVPVDCIRRRIWSDPGVEWWYAQNTILYVEGSTLADRARLQHEHELMGTGQLSVVHPCRLLELIEWYEQSASR